MTIEIWEPLNNFYEISTLGRVKSKRKGKELILKSHTSPNGYEIVYVTGEGLPGYSTVHRLMAKAFLGLTEDNKHLVVNHKDGNKRNNSLDNLELCTQSHNLRAPHFGKKRYVSFCNGTGKYRVFIRHNGKVNFFGNFLCIDQAYQVAREAYYKLYNTYPWSNA